jgi:hypothetical protein
MITKQQKDANAQIAMASLIKNGWTPMHAAAIVGNLIAESYLDPDTGRGDQGTAMGIAQWRNDRVAKFQEVIAVGVEDASFEQQLEFVNWELRNSQKKAGNLLKKAATIEDSTAVIDKYYERSFGGALDRRTKFAIATFAAWNANNG